MFAEGKRYNDFSSHIKTEFGQRVQKISLDIGFTCPNRDGSKGYGGCTYCNNNSFNPDYCAPDVSIPDQLEEGITFFEKRYKTQLYFAYFQAYTNTYADIEVLKKYYAEALSHPKVIGLVIGTRPDCISDEVIELLSEISKTHFVSLEFGVESTLNKTLLAVNRCHTFEDTQSTYNRCVDKGMQLGAHIILGLPGESREEMLGHAREISKLPVNTLKIHHLQIVKNSIMAFQYKKNPDQFQLFEMEEYIDFICEFVSLLRPDIIIERFISEAPKDLLIAPNWQRTKNYQIVSKIEQSLLEKDTWQGKNYRQN